jgi:hypothetical protein
VQIDYVLRYVKIGVITRNAAALVVAAAGRSRRTRPPPCWPLSSRSSPDSSLGRSRPLPTHPLLVPATSG